MADKTRIEWTDATWNPVTGCTKVSAGCKHCYAERDWARLSANKATRYYGRAFTDVQISYNTLYQVLAWKKPRRVFVNSMSDLFHPAVPTKFIADVFGVMAATPWHTYQVLTKRPERMLALLDDPGFPEAVEECMAMYSHSDLAWPLPNVWLGVSVEDQATTDARIPLLIDTPAVTRFVSCEPLLGPVDLSRWAELGGLDTDRGLSNPGLDWVIVGGESGPKARPMHPDWVRSLRDQCKAADVPFLFKQWGEWAPEGLPNIAYTDAQSHAWPDMNLSLRVGKKVAGRLLDGVEHNEYPEVRP